MKRFNLLVTTMFILSFALTSCDEGEDNKTTMDQVFYVSAEEYSSSSVQYTSSVAKEYFTTNGYTDLASKVDYDSRVFKVKYKTVFEGDTIVASGLICTPVAKSKNESFPMVSFQHGIITRKTDAPTANPEEETNLIVSYLANTGVIVLMPDYIGFGETEDEFPPFLYKEYTVNPILDFMRAAKEFIYFNDPCDWNDKLFMAGYSQGGSASLAALSAIENDTTNSDLTVSATASGAGLYDLEAWRDWVVNRLASDGKYEKPHYLIYMLKSFKTYAGLGIDYSAVFKSPYAELADGYIDGEETGEEIDDKLTFYMGDFLATNFTTEETYDSSSVYSGLKDVLSENSIEAWSLSSNVAFYYGKNDVWVPVELNTRMFQSFQTFGAGNKIKIVPIEDEDNETALVPMLNAALTWFSTF